MMRDPFDIVPAIHRESPRSALVTAFGSAIGAIAPVTGEASGTHIFRIGSRSHDYRRMPIIYDRNATHRPNRPTED
jgi:hypothetical protein